MSGETAAGVLYVRFRGGNDGDYSALLALLRGVTPVVQAVPPDAAFADVRGARRYFGLDAVRLAGLIRARALAWHGTDCTIGIAVNPLLARMATRGSAPGEIRGVSGTPGESPEVAAFLDGQPAVALHGVGPKAARALCSFGLDSVGRIAAAPPATLQRILGATTGRRVHALAHGIDPTPVVPSAPLRSESGEHRFLRDELDPGSRRRALLALAGEVGGRLRASRQVARALTLTVRYADRSATTRTRSLTEPTAHTPALAGAAYALHDALGLQRARVRAVSLRAEELTGAEQAGRQLSFDRRAADAQRLEPVLDRLNARWPGAVGPATLAKRRNVQGM